MRLKDAVLNAKYALRRARPSVRKFGAYDIVDNGSHTVFAEERC